MGVDSLLDWMRARVRLASPSPMALKFDGVFSVGDAEMLYPSRELEKFLFAPIGSADYRSRRHRAAPTMATA